MPAYDVFLSHASADKPAVEHIARKLREEGVFIGPRSGSGGGAWQMREVEYALARAAREDSFRIIPVILPGGDEHAVEELSVFLELLTWVDFLDLVEP